MSASVFYSRQNSSATGISGSLPNFGCQQLLINEEDDTDHVYEHKAIAYHSCRSTGLSGQQVTALVAQVPS